VKRSNLIILILLVLQFFSYVFAQFQNNLELVESIPIETTLDNPDIRNTQEVWLEMINSAKTTIDIEQFYISNEKGEPLDTILSAIVAAAKRGVTVRIIIDAKMYHTYPDDVEWMEKQSPNITKHVIDFERLAGGVQHSKFFIVDDAEVFLGSQNFDWRALKHIHELGIRFKHTDAIQVYRGIFNADWAYSEIDDGKSWHCPIFTISKNYHIDSDVYGKYIRLMPTTSPSDFDHPNSYKDLDVIKEIINSANNEINLQFLSYNPNTKDGYWDEVDNALVEASKRGVKVRLLVSDWNLSRTAVYHFQSLNNLPNFEVKYTAIPDHSGGFIPFARVEHCKFITADSTTWIGTSNMSRDYFYESRNVGMGIENAMFTQRVRRIFYKSWDSEYAVQITPFGIYEPRKRGW
jgi:phosphatidylserine/phosphatidylglycerophosphate/cardiolipin synthase-like enzyme